VTKHQGPSNFFADYKALETRVAALERTVASPGLMNIVSTGLNAAQIDALVFGGTKQAYDGATAMDTVNHLFLVRQSGAWRRVTLT
jgi:hypothetical protein